MATAVKAPVGITPPSIAQRGGVNATNAGPGVGPGAKIKTTPQASMLSPRQSGVFSRGLGFVDGAFNKITLLSFGGAMVAGGLKFIGKLPILGKPFKHLGGGLGKSIEYVNTKTVADVMPASMSGHIGNAATRAAGVASDAMKAAGAGETKLAQRVVNGLKNAPANITGRSLSDTAWVAGIYTGFGLQTIQTGKSLASELRTLKQLYADISGDAKPASTFKVMFGHVPPFVKEARRSVVKHILPEAIVNVLGFIINLKLAGRSGISGKKQIALIAMQMGGGSVASWLAGDSFLPTYAALYDAKAKGQAIAPEAYAEFIGVISKDAKKAGGAGNELVQAVSVHYAEQQASPAQIVKDIESGAFNRIATEAQQKLKAPPPVPGVAAPSAVPDAPQQKAALGPHSAKVVSGAIPAVSNNVMGPQTAQLAARQADAKSTVLGA